MVTPNNPTRSMLTATFYALIESLVHQPDPDIREELAGSFIEDVLDSLDDPDGDPSLTESPHIPSTRTIALLQQQQPEPNQNQVPHLSNHHSQKKQSIKRHTSLQQSDFSAQEEQQTTSQQPCPQSNQPI